MPVILCNRKKIINKCVGKKFNDLLILQNEWNIMAHVKIKGHSSIVKNEFKPKYVSRMNSNQNLQ